MKTFEKQMLVTIASFCADFADKQREGSYISDLKDMVLNMSLTMRPHSVNPGATRTYEQYGELMDFLVRYLACEDDEGAGVEFECFSAQRKMEMVNFALKQKIQHTADRINDDFSEKIERILIRA
ncbi:hypothetical protein LJ649_003375 [Salmonella enterica]|uniref:Uncharacterized protein n=1 Tax=Salmonella enterica TaxID=28901 RepID=A0A639X7Y2_SALER|nr:hypothetical protein [Salmonella enterica]EBV0974503.1 hypothetical protein [Salmonella enterica subsp. enterica serovar Miami]ECS9257864.1 hypothetical protein [Salmonella enterica subsp. enterica serovar Typhimurium]ECT9481868.1 hypothetical protein [Salmonella enterica subsp. enterica serovar Montevideo]ECU4133279.1 hypothetical protein [Salmonella enterica subsp. enterica serovar Thompson]EDL2902088.1 hypothetical protein [Salmonella enterica subsp. enterica serovar Muenchen]EDT7578874